MANKINEIVDVLNNGESVEALENRLDIVEQDVLEIKNELNKQWILCPNSSDFIIYDSETNRMNYDIKIDYNLKFNYSFPNVQGTLIKMVRGTVYINKDDIINSVDNVIDNSSLIYIYDNQPYSITTFYSNITLGMLDYFRKNQSASFTPKMVAVSESVTTSDKTVHTVNDEITVQSDDVTVNNTNLFINIYYKENE